MRLRATSSRQPLNKPMGISFGAAARSPGTRMSAPKQAGARRTVCANCRGICPTFKIE